MYAFGHSKKEKVTVCRSVVLRAQILYNEQGRRERNEEDNTKRCGFLVTPTAWHGKADR